MNESLRLKFERIGANREHGTVIRYASGCRCLPCRAASSRYRAECYQKQKTNPNPLISGAKVVRHLRKLSEQGVGYRSVSDVTGIHISTLQRLKNGDAKYIRYQSAQKILAVNVGVARNSARIPAGKTKRMLGHLMQSGFTPQMLAPRVGMKRIRIGERVRASTEMKIEKFYNRITAEAA